MAQEAKFSINVKPRFGDEFAASGVVHDLTYHVWTREAAFAYNDHLGIELPAYGRPTPLRIEAVNTTPLLMKEEAKVSYRISRIGRSSMTMETQINEAVSGRPVATITMVSVSVDPQTGRSIPVSDEDKQKIIAFEGKENVEVA